MTVTGFGVLACGAYLPRGRLPGAVLGAAHGWFDPAIGKTPHVRRSFCNWDEDAITMAVEASRDCLRQVDGAGIHRIELASTTLPFADRNNAGVLREALDLGNAVRLCDSGGSRRASSSALQSALEHAGAGSTLLVGSDCVETRPASPEEAGYGHGAAAVLVGEGEPLAVLRGNASHHEDFVDHYRAAGASFDYTLEARWTRDAGYREQAPAAYARALETAGLAADAIDHVGVAAPASLARAVGKMLERPALLGSDILDAAGYCGAAQPVLLLAAALQTAEPGENVAIVSLGQGVDVMLFEVVRRSTAGSLAARLGAGRDETNYVRYLALRGLLDIETGIRAERDNRTSQSAAFRKHEAISAFKGGLCTACDTLQFPPSILCVRCGAANTQRPRRIAELPGSVRSFTEDWLAYTPDPPLVFGNVGFEKGANVMMEFTDVDAGELSVGMPVSLQFRIKDFDERRLFRRYFWKAMPAREYADA